jgi:excisionase family DNA binding protein
MKDFRKTEVFFYVNFLQNSENRIKQVYLSALLRGIVISILKTEQGNKDGMETYLTADELAKYLKVSKHTVRRWVCKKIIPFCRLNHAVRFKLSEIEKWVTARETLVSMEVPKVRELDLFDFAENE